MMILPVSGLLMAPEVHYYFQKDFFKSHYEGRSLHSIFEKEL